MVPSPQYHLVPPPDEEEEDEEDDEEELPTEIVCRQLVNGALSLFTRHVAAYVPLDEYVQVAVFEAPEKDCPFPQSIVNALETRTSVGVHVSVLVSGAVEDELGDAESDRHDGMPPEEEEEDDDDVTVAVLRHVATGVVSVPTRHVATYVPALA